MTVEAREAPHRVRVALSRTERPAAVTRRLPARASTLRLAGALGLPDGGMVEDGAPPIRVAQAATSRVWFRAPEPPPLINIFDREIFTDGRGSRHCEDLSMCWSKLSAVP